jgi:predicted small lipoprotein YifL
VVIQSPKSSFARFAVLGAMVAALGLAGCGHNGGLDAPPMAAAAGDLDWLDRPPAPPPKALDAPPTAAAGDLEANGQPAPASTQEDAGKPVSPSAEKWNIFLDWLYSF